MTELQTPSHPRILRPSRSRACCNDSGLSVHTPSPLRKRVNLNYPISGDDGSDDGEYEGCNFRIKLDLPIRSPHRICQPFKTPLSPRSYKATENNEDSLFLSQSTSTSPTVLFTPTHTSEYRVLAFKDINTPSSHAKSPSRCPPSFTQPRLRPLARSNSFASLAPLSMPRFIPQTPVETERSFKRQADTMTRLSLCDDIENIEDSDVEFCTDMAVRTKRKRENHFLKKRGRALRPSKSSLHLSSPVPSTPSPINTDIAFSQDTSPSSPCPSIAQPSLKLSPPLHYSPPTLTVTRSCHSRQGSQSSTSSTITTTSADWQRGFPQSGIPKKYKPRDSGIGGLGDSDDESSLHSEIPQFRQVKLLTVVPPNDADDNLITPSFEPSVASNWPGILSSLSPSKDSLSSGNIKGDDIVNAFILKTLATGAAASAATAHEKKMPNTPVKRQAYLRVGTERPWMSSSKTERDHSLNSDGGLFGKQRKSLPLTMPNLSDTGSSSHSISSPIVSAPLANKNSPEAPYMGLGLGLPSTMARTTALRRLSSGSSFGSDLSLEGTPTRPRGGQLSSFASTDYAAHSCKKNCVLATSDSSSRELGKFERELEIVDDLGMGEFGKVMKVRYRNGYIPPEVEDKGYALKRSKRFEGVKHRRRLVEEADIMKRIRDEGPHPNVLNYVDSWEQDETLFIVTELCELGNFAHFLTEFGRRFERLEEVRCWKILADLSSGLRFLHHADIVHLDIKPENIFLTSTGRFVIGDFGMASLWPREDAGFEREGDKKYLAAEVLQGHYGKAADIFSLGMTMLETVANIMVPDMGEPWHKLRHDDFSQVDIPPESTVLFGVIRSMMRSDPQKRVRIEDVFGFSAVRRAREWMDRARRALELRGASSGMLFAASPLASVEDGVLEEILTEVRRGEPMDETG